MYIGVHYEGHQVTCSGVHDLGLAGVPLFRWPENQVKDGMLFMVPPPINQSDNHGR
jgi:hypothetical protein